MTPVRVPLLDPQGSPATPLGLQVRGRRREGLRPETALPHRQRFDGEHPLRFCKQGLWITPFLTPQAAREERGGRLAPLAYAQLWLARRHLPGGRSPWQKNLPERPWGPGEVQRGRGGFFARLAVQPRPVKRRGKSPGRPRGKRRKGRPRQPVVRPGANKA